jgi:hypothetical protein
MYACKHTYQSHIRTKTHTHIHTYIHAYIHQYMSTRRQKQKGRVRPKHDSEGFPIATSATKPAKKDREKSQYLDSDGNKIDTNTKALSVEKNRFGLPAGWEARLDAKGRTYYIDWSTRTSHWNPPPGCLPVKLTIPPANDGGNALSFGANDLADSKPAARFLTSTEGLEVGESARGTVLDGSRASRDSNLIPDRALQQADVDSDNGRMSVCPTRAQTADVSLLDTRTERQIYVADSKNISIKGPKSGHAHDSLAAYTGDEASALRSYNATAFEELVLKPREKLAPGPPPMFAGVSLSMCFVFLMPV